MENRWEWLCNHMCFPFCTIVNVSFRIFSTRKTRFKCTGLTSIQQLPFCSFLCLRLIFPPKWHSCDNSRAKCKPDVLLLSVPRWPKGQMRSPPSPGVPPTRGEQLIHLKSANIFRASPQRKGGGSQIGALNVLWGANSCQWKCKWLRGEWHPHNSPALTRPPGRHNDHCHGCCQVENVTCSRIPTSWSSACFWAAPLDDNGQYSFIASVSNARPAGLNRPSARFIWTVCHCIILKPQFKTCYMMTIECSGCLII